MHRTLPLFLTLLLATVSLAAGPEPLPTQADIKQAYDSAQYAAVLQKLSRVLPLKGKAAEPYDRHALLRIKGETHLRMKAVPSAAQAFGEASKETNDGPSTAQDIATELLLKKTTVGLVYQPKGKDPNDKTKPLPAIDVVEPEGRKKAIAALFADEWAAVDARVTALKQGKTLAPILDALPAIRNVRWLEMASTGHDEKSKAMVADLQTVAKRLLDTSLKDMEDDTESLARAAFEVVPARIPINDKQTGKILGFRTEYRYNGPTPRQMSTLQATLSTCVKIHDSSDELGGSLGSTGKEFDDIKVRSASLGSRVQAMVDNNWRKTYPTPPPGPPVK